MKASETILAEIKARHEKANADIQNNFGAAYSSRITQDKYSIHEDRGKLLALFSRSHVKAPAPVLTVGERKLVEDFKQAQREYPNASFASKWHNGLLAIIDRLTQPKDQPERKEGEK